MNFIKSKSFLQEELQKLQYDGTKPYNNNISHYQWAKCTAEWQDELEDLTQHFTD